MAKAKPTRAKLDTVETKARKGAKPVKSTQTRAQAKKVIAEGNAVKTRTVGAGLGVEEGKPQFDAKKEALRDMRGTDLEYTTSRSAVSKSLKELDAAREAAKKPSQRKATAAADFVDYKPMGRNAETGLINRQRKFEALPAGPAKERARQSIGRTLQTGIMSEAGGDAIKQIACQTPNCENSVKVLNGLDLTEANPKTGKPAGNGRALDRNEGDVVCRDCLRKGDVAGATYTDYNKASQASTNSGAGRITTARTRKAS
jgi:hypothetical protein